MQTAFLKMLCRLTYGLALLASLGLVMVLLIDGWFVWNARDRILQHPDQVPPQFQVALVLGTNKYMPSGQHNRFYVERIQSAAELYHAGKVNAIIVSGDNRQRNYNEPRQMRRDLIDQQVPADFITLDFAGFRTLDSVVRAQQVFEQQQVLIVTQAFHLERALFIADQHGLDALGFAATSPRWQGAPRVRLRDVAARVLAVWDTLRGRMPHFLGPAEAVPSRTVNDD